MRSLMPKTLQTKFLAGLLLAMGLLVGFFALTLNMHLERLMEGEAREKAALILSQVEAVQGYVRSILRPAMYRLLPEDQFVLEAMSTSYITRAVMSDQNLARESFTYRRVGVGARNPDYEADARERGYIGRFEADRDLQRLEEFVELDGAQHFITVRPQRFEAACLRCHGDPDEAPQELIARYGAERGFGRQVGDLAGIDLVRLKVQRDVGGIRDATFSFAFLFAAGILVLFLVIQGFFHRLVVQSLRRVTGVMQRLFPEEARRAVATPTRDDELEGILHGFETFAGHLRQARLDLTEYAATLEDKVATRTRAVTHLADERRADVALFVALLNSLNESQDKQQMLSAALSLTARRFGASRAGYVCVLSASDYAVWPEAGPRPELPEDWHDLVSAGEPRLTPQAWYIPVQTSGTSRGLLSLYWDETQEASGRLADLARAIGQQLGIAMENLDALDSLLRQNSLLSSIFEGIADPLLLLDTGGAVLLANTTARTLAASLPPSLEGGGGMDGLRALLAGATAEGGRGEFELALPEGGRIFEASLYPIAQPGGGRRHVASLREVTAERRMEGQMRRNERIVAVGQLAAGLAHEINNPLGVIRCYAELLQTSQQEPQAQADLTVIMRHTEQARRVVRDLLDFARPRPAEPGPSDLAAVAQATLDVLRPRGKASRAALLLETAPDLPLVRAGAEALEHILTNLVMNAQDAVAARPVDTEPGQVLLRLERCGDRVELTVRDNGPGIAPEHLDRVFDPFFTTKDVGKGTGLGLAVVYSLVRDLDGSIEVTSPPGGGAAFRVLLPAAEAAHEPGQE